MHIRYQIHADSADRARNIAINRATADGWDTISSVFVQQLDMWNYDIELVVTNIR